jgi:hypothetical protein
VPASPPQELKVILGTAEPRRRHRLHPRLPRGARLAQEPANKQAALDLFLRNVPNATPQSTTQVVVHHLTAYRVARAAASRHLGRSSRLRPTERLPMRTNYVFIDYESVQPDTIDALSGPHFRVLVFAGANQTKVSLPLATAMQRLGSRAEWVQITGNGPNALDFHIAYYVGRLSVSDAEAFFHVVSKDKGFDPLIRHLHSKNIFAARSANVDEIPAVRSASAKTLDDRLALVTERLQQLGAAAPKTAKGLRNMVATCFQKLLADDALDALVAALKSSGCVVASGSGVSYSFEAIAAPPKAARQVGMD